MTTASKACARRSPGSEVTARYRVYPGVKALLFCSALDEATKAECPHVRTEVLAVTGLTSCAELLRL